MKFLIVCPLVFLAGLIDSIAGGGGLVSLPAYLVSGIPPHLALGTNKLSSSIGTTIATVRYYKNKAIDLKIAILSSIFALIGSFVGANIALKIDEKVLKYLLIAVLPVLAFYLLREKKFGESTKINKLSKKKITALIIVSSLGIGCYDGLYGPGTGTFLILIYTGLLGLSAKTASGNSKLVNLSSNIAAVTTFLINGKIDIVLGLTAAIFSIAGNYIGSGLALKNGSKVIRPVIIVVLGILFSKIIIEYIMSM